jgi:hypothetical protein
MGVGMDFRKEFESRITPFSTFSEIVSAFEYICRIPSNSDDEMISYHAMRNKDVFEIYDEQPLFGSLDHLNKKTFFVELSRDYEDPSARENIILFTVTLGYPGEMWNLGLMNSCLMDESLDDFFHEVRSTRTYRYLTTHDCRPDFVQVYFGKAE